MKANEIKSSTHAKLVELEAVRGIAACVVLVHHCMLGFAPTLHGLVNPPTSWSLFGTPLFALVDGTAAVVVFFVLSGFVLTYRAIEKNDTTMVWLGAAKRWPRLIVPIVVVNIISALAAVSGLYTNGVAAKSTGSIWLGWFYQGSPYPGPLIPAAVYEGAVATFLFGGAYFNSNLWTMTFEFFGSFLVFGMALLFIKVKRYQYATVVGLAIIAAWFQPFYLCFIAGIGVAITRQWTFRVAGAVIRERWKVPAVTAGLALTVFLFGFHRHAAPSAGLGFYEFLATISAVNPSLFEVLLHTVGAVIILSLALAYPRPLNTRAGMLIGRLSFSIYLLHVPIICSVGAWLYVFLLPACGELATTIMTISCVIAVTIVAAFPLSRIDQLWLMTLRRTEPWLFRLVRSWRPDQIKA